MARSNRDLNHSDAVRMLGKLGFSAESNPTLPVQQRKGFKKGSADIRFVGRGVLAPDGLIWHSTGGYMEAKAAQDRFAFGSWADEQREWAHWIREEKGVEYWLYLTLKIKNRVNSPVDPKRTWLVPYPAWMEVEAALEGIQDSLVYAAKPGMRKEIQENHLDALHMLAHYELQWSTDDKTWIPGNSHPFHKLYVARLDTLETQAYDLRSERSISTRLLLPSAT